MSRTAASGLAAAMILSLAWASPVWAQGNPAGIGTAGAPPSRAQRERTSREQAPPALPGSRAEPAAVAPADRAAADLPPTDALFDAINRGDLATAKDAVARGADLNGTNVLGLTPLELSVDLGRNSISFLLLSLRGGSGYNAAGGPAPAEAARPPSRAERLAAERADRVARQQASARIAPPAAPQTARLFAGNGGSPVPQAGFLGFDAGR